MKKLVALVLALTLVCGLAVTAASSSTASDTSKGHATAAVSPEEAIAAAAAAEGKTAGEFMNNAIVEVPGLTGLTPVAGERHIVLNGAPSNVTFLLDKPDTNTVVSAKKVAATLSGWKIISLFETRSDVGSFKEAIVPYYVKGLPATAQIKVFQFDKELKKWVELTDVSVRSEHVVVKMKKHGKLMFMQKIEE